MAGPLHVAVVGAGWAGLAAAVQAAQMGHRVTVFEASETLGGRARTLPSRLPDGTPVQLDNGQHILIGAYIETLQLMQTVGVQPQLTLLKMPLQLQFVDGCGLRLPNWPAPLDLLAGVLMAGGWSLADKYALAGAGWRWRSQGFVCDDRLDVASLCRTLPARIQAELIEPLCVSALNTPASRASASVFLRLLQEVLFGKSGASHLLLPTTDLSALLPLASAAWLRQNGHQVWLRTPIHGLQRQGCRWHLSSQSAHQVSGLAFDAVIWATSASHAVKAIQQYSLAATGRDAELAANWAQTTQTLQFEAIATVYAWAPAARLKQPMLALRSSAAQPAQFVFDRAQLGGPKGLLAFVVSAAKGSRQTLQNQVLAQAQAQLGLSLQALQTVIEKRATFACRPNLRRPDAWIAPALLACGDYIAGPYPATLEGAVRSGKQSAQALADL